MHGRRAAERVGSRVAGGPAFRPCRCVPRAHHFVAVAPRECVDEFADYDRRAVAFTDLDLPAARQRVGPSRRLDERTRLSVAMASAPLRIVLRTALPSR